MPTAVIAAGIGAAGAIGSAALSKGKGDGQSGGKEKFDWISPAISAAGSIGTALVGSKGAKDAAKTQVQAANQATALQERLYDQARADNEPYRQAGNMALSELMKQGGFAPSPIATKPMGAESGSITASIGGRRNRMEPQGGFTRDGGDMGQAEPRMGRLSDLSIRPQVAQAQRQSSYVQMRAPDGSVQSVPSGQVNHFRARGAQLI